MALFATKECRCRGTVGDRAAVWVEQANKPLFPQPAPRGAVILAVTSVSRQLFHHPGVQVNKSNRSMMPEVDDPDTTLESGGKFLTRSVLRKVAHIQKRDDVVAMDHAPDVSSTYRPGDSTNLKTVGVDPRANRG